MPKGNPNPSPATRFKPGNPGGGKTSEQKRLEYEAAEMSARMTHRLLSVISENPDAIAETLSSMSPADVLRLLRDAQDRAHGTPRQSVEHTGANGGPLHIVERRIVRKGDNG